METLPVEKRDSLRTRWMEQLASFLHTGQGTGNPDNDFAVKLHAAVSPIEEPDESCYGTPC